MEIFQYKAVNPQGRIVWGRTNAQNSADLELRLQRLGLELITFQGLKSDKPLQIGRKISRKDLITFCLHLEQLLVAGVPILEGLSDLRDSIDTPSLKEVTAAMIESIQGGKNLSEAMRDFPHIFNNVFVSLIRVGEDSGQLLQVLQHIVENLKWLDEQAAYTKKLILYPSFVLVAISGALFFLMTYLVPELLKFIKVSAHELPMHTKVLLWVSNAFAHYWYLIIGLPVLTLIVGLTIAQRDPVMSMKLEGWLLRVPIIGGILKKIILTRFCKYFTIMYGAGIPVLDCIRVSEDVVGNKAVREALREAGRQIADGAGISASFANTGLFPPLVIRMLRVGENTGALENSLQNVSYFYSRDVKESVERLQALIEPTITIILGLILTWIMISVLGPIYDIITKVKF